MVRPATTEDRDVLDPRAHEAVERVRDDIAACEFALGLGQDPPVPGFDLPENFKSVQVDQPSQEELDQEEAQKAGERLLPRLQR